MPDAGTTWYVDRKEKMETAVIEDLIPDVEKNLKVLTTRSGRLVAGLSMGGYGAMRFVLKYPDRFAAAALLSPAIYNPEPPENSASRRVGVFGAPDYDPVVWKAYNYPALWDAYLAKKIPVPMYINSGDDDDFFIESEVVQFYELLRKNKQPAQLRIVDGAHVWAVWESTIGDAMKYIFRYSARPAMALARALGLVTGSIAASQRRSDRAPSPSRPSPLTSRKPNHVGKEHPEVCLEAVIMRGELRARAQQGVAALEPLAYAVQRDADGIDVPVRGEPVCRGHAWCDELQPLGEQRVAAPQGGVNPGREALQRKVRVVGPVTREEVVVEQIQQNARVATPLGAHARAAPRHHRVGVGIGVDASMQRQPSCDAGPMPRVERTLDEITHQAGDDGLVGAFGQIGMGQEIHSDKSAGRCCR